MKNYNIVYNENKKLDETFDVLYDNHNEDIVRKNILELLVEISELANETRCFKYWSVKKVDNREEILEEFADCMLMSLYFCNMIELDIENISLKDTESDIIKQFLKLYEISSKLSVSLEKDTIIDILINLVNLGKLLNFSEEEIIDGCLKKIKKNHSRFEMGF